MKALRAAQLVTALVMVTGSAPAASAQVDDLRNRLRDLQYSDATGNLTGRIEASFLPQGWRAELQVHVGVVGPSIVGGVPDVVTSDPRFSYRIPDRFRDGGTYIISVRGTITTTEGTYSVGYGSIRTQIGAALGVRITYLIPLSVTEPEIQAKVRQFGGTIVTLQRSWSAWYSSIDFPDTGAANAFKEAADLAFKTPKLELASPGTITGEVGDPLSAKLSTTGGSGGISFRLVWGQLPRGVNLSSNGTLSGTPQAAGSFTGIRVRALDGAGQIADAFLTFEIAQTDTPPTYGPRPVPLNQLEITTTWLSPSLGQWIDTRINVEKGDGTGYAAIELIQGRLPAGLSVYYNRIRGYVRESGTFRVQLRATDRAGNQATGWVTISVRSRSRSRGIGR